MNCPLAANFEATKVTFLPKKLASNVQSTCIDTQTAKIEVVTLLH